MLGQFGVDPLAEHPGVPDGQLSRQLQGVLQHLAGQPDPGALNREAGHHAAYQPGHPDHEELIQVVREDDQEPYPFKQRDRFVFGEFEHAFVEPEPALLAVQEAFFGQPFVLPLALLGGHADLG